MSDYSNRWLLKDVQVGDYIRFEEEVKKYEVRARNTDYLIMTKPFVNNRVRTVQYCIVDLINNIRGPENLIFGMGAETTEQCEAMLDRLISNESEVSFRNKLPLRMKKIFLNKDKHDMP